MKSLTLLGSIIIGTVVATAIFVRKVDAEQRAQRRMVIINDMIERVNQINQDYEESKEVRGQA